MIRFSALSPLRRLALLGLALVLASLPQMAWALGCEQYQWSKSAYDRSDLVFVGTAVEVKSIQNGSEKQTQFDVDHYWKGFSPNVVLISRIGENTLDYPFHRGERYLVHAHQINTSGFYYAKVCGEVEDITGQNLIWFYFSFLNRQFPIAIIAVTVMLALATLKVWLTRKYG